MMNNSRTYLHRRCRTETTVDGGEFQAMSDPLAGMRTTYCVKCDQQFPVDEYEWSDTNELISAYYARYRKKATAADLWWCGNGGLAFLAGIGVLTGAILGIILGVKVSLVVGLIAGFVLSIAGAIVGVVVRETILSRSIVRRVCGVKDTRMLR
ncbi:hypothetical protein SH501x_001621 [Pirellulaceae bacterium SH501]